MKTDIRESETHLWEYHRSIIQTASVQTQPLNGTPGGLVHIIRSALW